MPFDSKSWKLPKAEGLYNPALEKDACGVGFIVNIEGKSSRKVSYYFGCKTNFREIDFCSLYIWFHEFFLFLFVYILLCLPKIVEDAAKFSQRMEHRGACSSDNATGDGAGALMAIPHDFYVKELRYDYYFLKNIFST